MEAMVKKYQQKFRKIRDEINKWDELQTRLLSQFRNSSSIIERLPVIQDSKNYGGLKCVDGIGDAVLRKQVQSLQTILHSMNTTLEEFRGVVMSLEKILRDGRQQAKGGSAQATTKQLQLRVGVKPSLADCLDGIKLLHEMHLSEYLLKSSVVSALSALALKPSASDLGALQQLLIDQPNIPKEEGLLEEHGLPFPQFSESLYQGELLRLTTDWRIKGTFANYTPKHALNDHISNQLKRRRSSPNPGFDSQFKAKRRNTSISAGDNGDGNPKVQEKLTRSEPDFPSLEDDDTNNGSTSGSLISSSDDGCLAQFESTDVMRNKSYAHDLLTFERRLRTDLFKIMRDKKHPFEEVFQMGTSFTLRGMIMRRGLGCVLLKDSITSTTQETS